VPRAEDLWSGPAAKWTSQNLWSGETLPADHALADTQKADVPSLKR
jgi:hypothetical protein